MNIGAVARRHGTTALLGLAIAGLGTATALAGSAPLPTALPVSPRLSASPVAFTKARPAQAKSAKSIRNRRQAQAVPFFAFPPRI